MNDSDIEARLSSPDNLINRLRSKMSGVSSGSELVTQTAKENAITAARVEILPAGARFNSFLQSEKATPDITDLIDDAADKIKSSLAQTSALDVLNETLDQLRMRLEEAESPGVLGRIARDMSMVIASVKGSSKLEVNQTHNQVIIYKPVMHDERHYDSIAVNE